MYIFEKGNCKMAARTLLQAAAFRNNGWKEIKAEVKPKTESAVKAESDTATKDAIQGDRKAAKAT